ncbi:hypothetical protein [Streptomyces sp. NK15101]|uniref:hypothetical protein n=1 Tax=Streptomyces sp. NK15101 TaxID=2873261 RepID=UPI001CEDF042|nr:hypothetical protein [Streptomyces sp. NK15101]
MPITDGTRRFISLSARLTGFDRAELEVTGLVETYRAVAAQELGAERYERLLNEALHEPQKPTATLRGESRAAAQAVTHLWYTAVGRAVHEGWCPRVPMPRASYGRRPV